MATTHKPKLVDYCRPDEENYRWLLNFNIVGVNPTPLPSQTETTEMTHKPRWSLESAAHTCMAWARFSRSLSLHLSVLTPPDNR